MPSTVRIVNRLYTLLIGAVLIIAALTIAVVALVGSNQTASCVNRTQGERADATRILYDAQLAKTSAEIAWLRGRASKASYALAVDRFAAEQARAKQYRAEHPAGRC